MICSDQQYLGDRDEWLLNQTKIKLEAFKIPTDEYRAYLLDSLTNKLENKKININFGK